MAKYCDMPTCDLRHLNDPEAIRQIEKICDIAQLILPSDASPEVMSAFASVPMEDIANILYIPQKAELSCINGVGVINAASKVERYININGVALVKNIADDAKVTININGFCLIDEPLKGHPGIVLSSVNGLVAYGDLSIEPKFFNNEVTLDADTIRYLKNKQLVCVGNELTFADDVSVELLVEKELNFFVGNKLICPKHLAGYLKANATIGNKLEIIE